MSVKNVGAAVIAAAAAGAVALGGGALADATTVSGTPTSAAAVSDLAASIQPGAQPSADASSDTPVTGDELAKVTAAVKAKDSSVTVQSVGKDPDGSYDVFGTRAGSPVRFEVSADLKTITEGGGHGPR